MVGGRRDTRGCAVKRASAPRSTESVLIPTGLRIRPSEDAGVAVPSGTVTFLFTDVRHVLP